MTPTKARIHIMSYDHNPPENEKKQMQWPEALVVSTLLVCITIILSQVI